MNAQQLIKGYYKDRNVLLNWFEVTPFKQSNPEQVDIIFSTLDSFFGRDFFDVKGGKDLPIQKISWIFGLLGNNDKKGCLFALLDVCALIGYLKHLPPELQKEAKDLQKNPENLRTFFYELFIYRILDANNVYNLKKPKINEQYVEGICRMQGIDHLFECRKMFMPNVLDLDVKRRLMVQMNLAFTKIKGARGFIATCTFKGQTSGVHLHGFTEKFKAFIAQLPPGDNNAIINHHEDSEIGSLDIINFDEEKLAEIKAAKNYDVVCFMPEPTLTEAGWLFDGGRVDANFSVSENLIYTKLETVFREKRKQHIDSPFEHKIIFLDNEILPEFQMNMFQHDNMYKLDRIKEVYNKVGMTEIVCITRREYFEDGGCIGVDVIAPEHLENMAISVKNLFSIMYSWANPQ